MSSKRLPDDQSARDRIAFDLHRNLLVEAGAGSGKTHEMARRMAAGIAEGVYQIEHIAAVTFTRKAAAELRGRFQLALEDELARSLRLKPQPAERLARLHRALSNLESFFAGTIHAFCARLLRERPVEAGVSPGFTELDEVEDELLRRESWRDFVAALKSAGDPGLTELLDAGIKPKDLDGAFEIVCLYDDVEFPPGDARRPDTAVPSQALDAFWGFLRKKLPANISPDTTCPTHRAATKSFRQMRVAASRKTRPGTLVSLLETWDFEPKIIQKWWADDETDVWMPLVPTPQEANRGWHAFPMVGRLKPGVTIEQARADLEPIMQRLARDYAETNTGRDAMVIPFQSWNLDSGVRRRLFVLQIAALILFFMSYANVSSLLLARYSSRRMEFAVRAALGASRARQIAQHVTESLLLTGLGCIGAVAVAWAGVRSLLWLYKDRMPRATEIAPDWRLVATVVLVAHGGSVFIGLATAFHEKRKNLQRSIHEGGRTIGSRRAAFTRRTLVVFQVACAVTLLAGAGEILQSFWTLLHIVVLGNSKRSCYEAGIAHGE